MDAHESSTEKGDEKTGRPDTNAGASVVRRNTVTSHTSLDSYDSALGDDADVDDLDPLNDEMDNAEIHRRKKAQLAANGAYRGRKEHKATPNGVTGPEYQSMPRSEDLEMEDLGNDEGLSDDEETGLTKIDKRRRKRRRRATTDLDARIGGSTMTANQEQKLADKAVLRSMIINVILIGSWYFFSLTLSIVGHQYFEMEQASDHIYSITSGCSVRSIWTSTSPYSSHVSTCLCSSALLPWSFSSFPHCALATTALQTLTTRRDLQETPRRPRSHL